MTPSKKRRMGREAFSPGCDPMDVQPFKTDSWGYEMDLEDFLDGWKEAEDGDLATEQEAEEISRVETQAQDELKEFLRDNLEIVVKYERQYSPGNNAIIGLRFKGEDKCFSTDMVYIPSKEYDE